MWEISSTQHQLCQRRYCKRCTLMLLRYLADRWVENIVSESIVLGKQTRATELNLLTTVQLSGLPTNNIEAERHLAEFGKRAAVAKYKNKNFTDKAIRNDCTLLLSNFSLKNTGKGSIHVVKMGKKKSQYILKCLQLCKGWGGPSTGVDELHHILRSHADMKEKIVRNESIYNGDMHKSDVLDNPTMFKVNQN
ncbi:unnamed protein product [Lepeophtheirus salmonis]|uniref:(salmon louse) hypothetical protein n=1 Tax=Lepeophtheirus salmonis TaxID=72036 RepID=A0A7R8CGW1_LEPSM|nr:unnamed protein product [Lepeophtheirus salmonis]CAF2819209.1 unnamed protein product [Lepeophtheirus salmonis]